MLYRTLKWLASLPEHSFDIIDCYPINFEEITYDDGLQKY